MSESDSANTENSAKNEPTYHSGFDLFPERRNKDFKLGTWQRLFGSKSTANKFKCEKNVIHNIEKSPLVRLMMRALASSGCPIDIKRHIVCEQCDTNVTGGYDQEMNQIVICENACSGKRMVQGVLAHEMIHMFDHCVNKMDLKNIEHLACTEVRAANLTHCSFITAMMHGNASFLDVRKSHAQCVKDKAIYSILAVYDISVEKALEVVNRVFTQCYNDLEPVGRRIRRNSHDMFQALEEANYFY